MNHTIRPAVPEDLDAVARVLASSFADYPWTRWAIPAIDYSQRLEELQRLYLSHALEHGLVVVDDRLSAVAAFLPPNSPAPSDTLQRRVAELHGPRLDALSNLTLPEAPPDHWTLETAGVDPSRQGNGLGTAVITAGLERIDEHGGSVSLETSEERNVRLYQRLGFDVVATTEIPDGPRVHSMVRGATAK